MLPYPQHRLLKPQLLATAMSLGVVAINWLPALAQKVTQAPTSFVLPKTARDEESRWTQISPTQYRETYSRNSRTPSNVMRVVGRAKMNGVPGTVVARPNIKVFIPDLKSGSTWVGLHWNGYWNKKWRHLANATQDKKLLASWQKRKSNPDR